MPCRSSPSARGVLCLLDVLEHFPSDRLEARLREIVSACGGSSELVMVKVPVAGLLYTGASTLSRLGVARSAPSALPGRRTWPPHFNYFSPASAERLFAAAGAFRDRSASETPTSSPSRSG